MDRFNNQVLKEAIHLCAFENGLLNYCFVMSSKNLQGLYRIFHQTIVYQTSYYIIRTLS